jgi:pimeloyl-ACP methyl ester carboxylesterase
MRPWLRIVLLAGAVALGCALLAATISYVLADSPKVAATVRQDRELPRKVLILAGACNTLIGPEHQKHHLKLLGHAELQVLPDTGHMMLEEKPRETQALIRAYLAEPAEAPSGQK